MALIEVKYFNSFVLKKIAPINATSSTPPVWDGSRGIPTAIGGYSQVADEEQTHCWAIEDSRIRGGFNNTSVSFGPKAYIVEEEPSGSVRGNAMIYSGIFNSRTGINNTNQFSVGEEITKATDPANGSIQRLYAEDSNLIIFSEKKVSRALIDKDAIYTAEGGGVPVSQLNLVIGQIVPYAGEFGIGDHPESFAVYGYRKYFVDKNRNAVLRLSRDGITEISNYGMVDWFRDKLAEVDDVNSFGLGKIIGGWDIYTKQYVVSLQQNESNPQATFYTLSFDESVLGWPSFYSFKPDVMFSLKNKFFTGGKQLGPVGQEETSVWQQNADDITTPRANFYGVQYKSNITFVINPQPSISKVFKTINYEGSNGWKVVQFESDFTGYDSVDVGPGPTYTPVWITPQHRDVGTGSTGEIYSYYEGEYVINPANNQPVYRVETSPGAADDYSNVLGTEDPPFDKYHAGFTRKENKYYANLVNFSNAQPGEVAFGSKITGIKAHYCTVTIENDDYTQPGGMKELFAVSSEFTM
jgi:hypothetical protein